MNKKKVIAVVAVLVVVLACAGGGKLWLDHASASGQRPDSQQGDQAGQETPPVETPDGPAPSFAVPTPIPASATGAVGQTGGEVQSVDAAPTITEDEDGNVTIVPNWEAKAQYAHPVDKAPEANMGGSGGGELPMTDGVYLGDHPGEETPAPTPKATAAPTPAPTPAATPAPSASPAVTPTPSATPGVTPPTEKPDGETQTPDDGNQQPANPTPAPTNAPDPVPPDAPSKPSGGSSLPPDDGTRYNGEISPDGGSMWLKGFGWVNNVGPGESVPGKGTHTEDGGDIVGDM